MRAVAPEALHGYLESLARDGLPAPCEISHPSVPRADGPVQPRVSWPRKLLATLDGMCCAMHHVRGSRHYLKHPDDPATSVTMALHKKP